MFEGITREVLKVPPVTRFMCGSAFVISFTVMLDIVSAYRIIFVRSLVTEKLEVRFILVQRLWGFITLFVVCGNLNARSGDYLRRRSLLVSALLPAKINRYS